MKMLEPPDLDADTRSVIDAARSGYEPNEMARARVRRGVELKIAAGVALAVGPASAVAGVLKVTAAVVTVGAVVTAGVYVAPRYLAKHAPARPATHVATHVAPVAPAPPPEIDIPAPAVAPAPRVHVKHRAPVAAPPPPPVENVSSLKEETALLGAANAALARNDVKRALALLDDYDHRAAGSTVLSEERTVTGILAQCAAGHVEAARAEARHFHARWPRSPLGARVDGSCAGGDGGGRNTP